jgi:dihydrofolate reductase
MRKITFGVANSVDNYIARTDDAIDWLMPGREAAAVLADYWKGIDTILMGRKTYDVALRRDEGETIQSFGLQTYVFSRTLKPDTKGHVTIVSSDAVDFVRALRGREGKDIALVSGGQLARALLEAGLIDEIRLNIQPVLLGSGIPLFHPMAGELRLELLESRQFSNGCVLVRYGLKPEVRRQQGGVIS